MSVSPTCSIAESRDQTKCLLCDRLRSKKRANPGSYVSDTLCELLQNITIGGAGNRTHSEKRSSKSATEESIAFHFTDERIEIAKKEMNESKVCNEGCNEQSNEMMVTAEH